MEHLLIIPVAGVIAFILSSIQGMNELSRNRVANLQKSKTCLDEVPAIHIGYKSHIA